MYPAGDVLRAGGQNLGTAQTSLGSLGTVGTGARPGTPERSLEAPGPGESRGANCRDEEAAGEPEEPAITQRRQTDVRRT